MPRKYLLAPPLKGSKKGFIHLSSYTKLLPASYNISAGVSTYLITSENPHELQTMQFGMTPYWAKKPMELINTRAEGDKNPTNEPGYSGPLQIYLKKAFMKPLQSQHCLMLPDAFNEWDRVVQSGRFCRLNTIPYLF